MEVSDYKFKKYFKNTVITTVGSSPPGHIIYQNASENPYRYSSLCVVSARWVRGYVPPRKFFKFM